jgi:hypothetical protein
MSNIFNNIRRIIFDQKTVEIITGILLFGLFYGATSSIIFGIIFTLMFITTDGYVFATKKIRSVILNYSTIGRVRNFDNLPLTKDSYNKRTYNQLVEYLRSNNLILDLNESGNEIYILNTKKQKEYKLKLHKGKWDVIELNSGNNSTRNIKHYDMLFNDQNITLFMRVLNTI